MVIPKEKGIIPAMAATAALTKKIEVLADQMQTAAQMRTAAEMETAARIMTAEALAAAEEDTAFLLLIRINTIWREEEDASVMFLQKPKMKLPKNSNMIWLDEKEEYLDKRIFSIRL